jgi:hypothetical protein
MVSCSISVHPSGGDMARPLRYLLPAAALAVALPVPALAQTSQPEQRRSAPDSVRTLAGLPVFTSDGKAIGTAIAMGLDDDNEPVLVAEIAQTLGLGPTAIAVPTDMFVRKADRVELTLTEAEVYARLGR